MCFSKSWEDLSFILQAFLQFFLFYFILFLLHLMARWIVVELLKKAFHHYGYIKNLTKSFPILEFKQHSSLILHIRNPNSSQCSGNKIF